MIASTTTSPVQTPKTAIAAIAPNVRYQVHTDEEITYLIVDTANGNRVVRDADGPLIWGNDIEDKAMAFYFAHGLNALRTVTELRAGLPEIYAGR